MSVSVCERETEVCAPYIIATFTREIYICVDIQIPSTLPCMSKRFHIVLVVSINKFLQIPYTLPCMSKRFHIFLVVNINKLL